MLVLVLALMSEIWIVNCGVNVGDLERPHQRALAQRRPPEAAEKWQMSVRCTLRTATATLYGWVVKISTSVGLYAVVKSCRSADARVLYPGIIQHHNRYL
jgi:hypothetical protein